MVLECGDLKKSCGALPSYVLLLTLITGVANYIFVLNDRFFFKKK